MKTLLLMLLFDSLAFGANSKVEGYENIKFGMSYQEVADVNICKTFEPVHPFGSPDTITTTGCKDFVVDGEATQAAFVFKKGKLVRFSFVVPGHLASDSGGIGQYISDSAKKYGPEKDNQSQKMKFLKQLSAVWEIPFGNGQARIVFLNTNVWDTKADGFAAALASEYQISFGPRPVYAMAVFNSLDFVKFRSK